MLRIIWQFTFVVITASWLRADVVNLKDGSRVEGKVRRDGDGWIIKNNSSVVHVSSDQVESIELIPATNPSAAAMQVRFDSLRHSLEGLSDLPEIIARVQRFADQNPTDTQAKNEVALWKDRQDQRMVKVGPSWVLPQVRDQLLQQAQANIERARQFMKQGRNKEAGALLTEALITDPKNPAGNFLLGLQFVQQDQLAAARKSFELVVDEVPNYAPALTNLAIVEWKQKQFISALGHFDSAMLSMPLNQAILDNVQAVAAVLPDELQKAPVTLRLLGHFNQQQTQLSDRMARQGLHRMNGRWVTAQEMTQLKSKNEQTLQTLDRLSGEFDQTKDRVKKLDQTIQDDLTQMHQIEAGNYIAGLGIGLAFNGYPPVYYNLDSDVKRMQNQKSEAVARLDAIKSDADSLDVNRVAGQATGEGVLFGVEATPLRVLPTTAK